jgi:predicted signal transduction protein with EAL and GGDEF domain
MRTKNQRTFGGTRLAGGSSRRLLCIDDAEAMHESYRKILTGGPQRRCSDLAGAADGLFGNKAPTLPSLPQVSFSLDHAFDGAAGLAKVETAIEECRPYEVAIVDMRMPPGWDGTETIRRIWQADPSLHICLCTAFGDHEWSDMLRHLGVSDRLLVIKKPFDPIEIRQATLAMSEKWRSEQRWKNQVASLEAVVRGRNAELQRASLHDRLTDLPNRRLFTDRLDRVIERQRQDPDRKFAVLFFDFDRFKIINDSLGHAAGDDMLRQIAHRLAEAVRAGDTVSSERDKALVANNQEPSGLVTAARVGGDEFIVLLDDIREFSDAQGVAQRLLDRLAKPYRLGGRTIRCTATVGITTSALRYGDAESMIRDADTAMYRGKTETRDGGDVGDCGRSVVFDEEMHKQAVERLRVEGDLRGAADRGELRLLYQPIVKASDGSLGGFEALMRWEHPTDGMLGPAAFIAAAEESGLITELGDWTLRAACEQFLSWNPPVGDGTTPPPISVNVNLSRRQLGDPKLLPTVRELVEQHGLGDGRLKLEVTESGVMRDPDRSVGKLRELRQMGCRIVMDDFGTGYSSLSCLHQFPLDCVKLDRSFICSLAERGDYIAVVRAIVTLCDALDIELVAEGVETTEQWNVLRDLGCDLLQGYYFGRPLPVEQAGPLVQAPRHYVLCDGVAREPIERPPLALAA